MNSRVVVVTGAGGGIGRIVTARWLDRGASVVAVEAHERAHEALRAETGDPPALHCVTADLSTESGAQSVVRAAGEKFGEPDSLIHLVGGFAMGPIEAEDAPANWDRMVSMNLHTTFHAFRAMVPVLRSRGGGWLVAMGTKAVHAPPAKMGAYVAGKAGLIAFCRSLSEEVKADGIHVNWILPSTVDTPANREAMGEDNAHKWVSADDIADATLYLCSDAAKALYGTSLEVYGLS